MFFFRYLSIKVGPPDIDDGSNGMRPTTPHECRLRDLNYSAPILVDIEHIRNNQRIRNTNMIIGR